MWKKVFRVANPKKLQIRTNSLSFLQIQANWLLFFSSGPHQDVQYANVPKPALKSQRKPYPTPMKLLIRRAKQEKEERKANPCRLLEAPENGLLVPDLIPGAHEVYQARNQLLEGLNKLINAVPVKRCRFCSEVYVGLVGHKIRTCRGPKSGFRSATHVWRKGSVEDVVGFPRCYHLEDRVGKPRIIHDERAKIQRLPAIVELCIQAGLDLEDYPTKRRTRPVYSIEGRIVDFEPEVDEDEDKEDDNNVDHVSVSFEVAENLSELTSENLSELSTKTLASWFRMREGAERIMKKYSVKTCGYCPEVQVGPKGHKVRMCKAAKHQFRDGLHAWQEATIDDLVGLNYVWHVRNPDGPTLINDLKRFYGKAPAVVELCVQAGAPVPDEYRSMMRLDVVSPDIDEADLVA